MLTAKQEKFCQCIVQGMTGLDSYMTAYNSTSRNVANVESTKLMKRDDITERIKELYAPIINHAQNAAISNRKRQIEEIQKRIEICKKKDDEQSLIRYYDMLNKIYALYKDNEPEQKQDTAVNKLDTDTLLRLSGAS